MLHVIGDHDDQCLAFISDASMDFTPIDFDAPLNVQQQAYLKTNTGFNIPQVFWRKQIHGDDVIQAKGQSSDCKASADADAFVTDQCCLPIAIRTADCVPVFIYDPKRHVIGLAHAGWQGTFKQIAAKTVQTMHDKYGCQCYDLKVTLGPCIQPCCYQVGPEFREYFPQDVHERNGQLFADVTNANRRQLMTAGVLDENIINTQICTHCSKDYFSFRRDGANAGRMISLMMLL